ncbi:MAG: response regulator transcription factor [Clostridia bacterium]|nr:response regulator transcription factor [Clostridia bacterium]
MSKSAKRNVLLSVMFTAAVFLQLCVLGVANHAGEGYLPAERREWVYYALQVFVIIGFFAYAAVRAALRGRRAERVILAAALCVFFAGTAVMLVCGGSPFSLVVTFATVLCLGFWCGAVYERMSEAAASGARAAAVMGVSYAAAVALQFVLALEWGITPLFYVFMPAAFVVLCVMLLRPPRALSVSQEAPASAPAPTPKMSVLFACLIAAALLLFSSFYNGYIHHLQVSSGYTDYNVYSWPRLMLIPCYLLFALIGDRQKGRAVRAAAVCIALVALLNSVLIGNAEAYSLNMCLFYCAIAGAVSYYNLTFWRLAQGTKHPALWASMGRIIDSGTVLLAGALHISSLPASSVLALDIVYLAAIIVLMALGDRSAAPAADKTAPGAPREDVFDVIRGRYELTARETDVFRELVLTEDKQTVIGERLSIRPRTVQLYVTSLYQKTGASTRAGLTDIYHETLSGR